MYKFLYNDRKIFKRNWDRKKSWALNTLEDPPILANDHITLEKPS